jgi:hypothetical protein
MQHPMERQQQPDLRNSLLQHKHERPALLEDHDGLKALMQRRCSTIPLAPGATHLAA